MWIGHTRRKITSQAYFRTLKENDSGAGQGLPGGDIWMRISKEWVITEKKQKNRIEGPGEILIAAFAFDGVAGTPPPPYRIT